MNQSFVEIVESSIMFSRPLLLVILCFGFLILLQSFVPKAMALQRSSNVNEFVLEDQRTRKRKNYVVRMARDKDILGNNDNMGTSYETEPFPTDTSPEELSAFIVDYANMMRDDVILLDNSVETRTRKRGNIKVKKYNQAISDPPCNCEYNRKSMDFGETAYPRFVETRNCSKVQQTCLPPYICKENLYNLTILRRRGRESLWQEVTEIPNELKYKWVAEKRPISVGCVCVRDYVIEN